MSEAQKPPLLVRQVDAETAKAAITEAVARAVNEASESLRAIREWCDTTEAVDCSHESEYVCRRNEVVKDCAKAVRALLPAVPDGRNET